jgi:photosystem II stability/assembly factor-like uncharacterized protein
MAEAVCTGVLVLAGTKDGIYLFRSDADRRSWRRSGPFLSGHDVTHVVRDARDGVLWAAANPKDGPPAIFRSEDEGRRWTKCGALPACERVWHVRPGRTGENGCVWAGIMPATLLRSDDRGATWQDVPGLNQHSSRPEWWPGGGGLCLHTIILPEGRPGRVYAGISVAGFFRSDDDGETWRPANEGTSSMAEVVAAEMPNGRVEHPGVHRCVHKVVPDPSNPERLYMQQHDGVYRSDDGGRSWRDIGANLPSPFGFPIAAAPGAGAAGCIIWVIPENGETIRTSDEGLRVWRSDDGGERWMPSVNGLPRGQHNVLREGMAADTLRPAGVYFGTTGGTLFASSDGGAHWAAIATGLPRIQSVQVAVIA